MKPLVPVVGSKRRRLANAMTAWGLRILGGELVRRPGRSPSTLRRFERLRKSANLLMAAAKPMQFGAEREGDCVKAGVYVPHWPSEALETRMRRALRSAVVPHEQVTLSITDECPYRCPHCSNARNPQKPLPLSRLLELVGEIQDLGGSWLNIGGGEPGVVYDRALATVKAADGRSETWLNTVGFDLDDEKARTFKQAGLFGGRVSIHSYKAAEHDDFVQYKGAFRIATDAVQTFRRAGIFPVMTAAMPEERITWDVVEDLLRLGRDIGAGIVEILPIRPAGRAIIKCIHSTLTRHAVADEIIKTFNTDPRFRDYPNVNSPAYFETPDRFGCVAGSERIYLSAGGDVQPCPLVNLSVGNVLQESLSSISRRMRSMISSPRQELLCVQLGPLVSQYMAASEKTTAKLPVDPEGSSEMLRQLPPSALPAGWA